MLEGDHAKLGVPKCQSSDTRSGVEGDKEFVSITQGVPG